MKNAESHSRRIGRVLVERLGGAVTLGLTERDLAEQPFDPPGHAFVDASLTAASELSPEQVKTLSLSERFISEIENSSAFVIDTPKALTVGMAPVTSSARRGRSPYRLADDTQNDNQAGDDDGPSGGVLPQA